VRWPVLRAAFDFTLILAAVALNRAIPTELLALYVVTIATLFVVSGMYLSRMRLEVLGKVPLTVWKITVAVMTLVTVDFMVLRLNVSPAQVFWLWFDTVVLLLMGRLLASPIRTALSRVEVKRKTLIVGSGAAAVLLAQKIESHPEIGLEAIGFVDDGPRRSVRGRHEPLLGGLAELGSVVEKTKADVVIFGYTRNPASEMLTALYQADNHVEVLVMPRYYQFVSAGMRVDDVAGMPLLRVNRQELGLFNRFLKRSEDLLIGGLASLIVLPLVPFIALAIKLDSPGPVFFAHDRVGKGGKHFRMYKFRSMSDCVDSDEDACSRTNDDSAAYEVKSLEQNPRLKGKPIWRVTKVGKFLRSSSLDELPQLFNVMRGDMSLVGPRPPLVEEVEAYDDWQKKRLAVAPGITGMWQAHGRSDLPFDEMVWLDFSYIDSWSIGLDLRILIQTIPAVLMRRGAY
jgi:exopolysaccharide biosynthesis polyprenyl glycosylphosphotransferase